MKTMLAVLVIVCAGKTEAFGGGGGAYECKIDPRGVMVCYPKPRGF